MNEEERVGHAPEDGAGVTPDPTLTALLVVLRLLDRPLDEAELRRRSGTRGTFDLHAVLEAASACDLQAERIKVAPGQLARLPAPALVETREGRLLVLIRGEGEAPLLLDPATGREAPEARLTGQAVVFRHGRHDSSPSPGFGLRSFLPGLLRYRGTLVQLLGASLFIQLFAMVTPLFTMVIIDKVLTTGAMSTLDVLILGLGAIALFDLAIGLLRGSLLADITNRIDVDLVARLFRHLTRLPMSYFGARKTGDTVARVRELEAVRQFLTGPSLTAVVDFAFALVFLSVMALFSIEMTAVVGVAIVGLLAIYGLAAPLMKRRLERRSASVADSQSFLVEAVSAIETIKSLSLEPQKQREWEECVVEQTRHARQSERLTAGFSQTAQFLSKATVALTLWIGANAVIAGTMTAGELIAFNMMVGRVMAPALRLAQLFQQLSQTRVSLRRLAEIFDTQPEPAAPTAGDRLPPMRGAVRLEQVSFRYRADAPDALRDVSLAVRPGEVVGVAGASGSGKSSLLRLLQRLYVPMQGRVLIDGVNVAGIDPVWLRRQVGAVTQDSVLFNATVRENIAAARPDLPIEAVERAARLAAADDFIRALPRAYDTPVGERGAQLSVGQRQRIALARALAAEPRLLLLDEPTSALDALAERAIQENLAEMVRGRTVFIVAHRLSTLRICDRVLVLDGGCLIEDGPPRALLRTDGAFARLQRAQIPFAPAGREVHDEALAS